MKTKTMKRMLAAAAAVTMMCSVPMFGMTSVNAANHNITINKPSGDIERTYTAYQIFKGDYSSGTLSNITWNDSVIDGSALITKLKASSVFGTSFSSVSDATAVANVLKNWNDSSNKAELAEFAKLAKESLKSDAPGSSISTGTATSLEEGYYLITDNTTGSVASFSRALLALNGDVSISPKTVVPVLEKKIVDGGNTVDANTAAIGEDVNYKLTSTVPDMTGYNKYYFIVNDTLSTGLTLNYDSVKSAREATGGKKFTVTVGGVTLTDITDISLSSGVYSDSTEYNDTGKSYYVVQDGQSFKLVFVNFKQYAKDAAITIEYSAALNDSAAFGTNTSGSNTNTASLEYANNPNFDYIGEPGSTTDNTKTDNTSTPQDETKKKPDEPNPGQPNNDSATPQDDTKPDPTSSTTPDTVYTYTSKLTVTKKDGSNAALNGAGFTLYGSNGSGKDTSNVVINEIQLANDNVFEFKGLKEGTYYLEETTVPAGYNKAADVKIVIGKTIDSNNAVTWDKSGSDSEVSLSSSEFAVTVVNQAGTTLPSTGGIGTTIFYVSGGTLIVGAAVVLITKKRMSIKDENK